MLVAPDCHFFACCNATISSAVEGRLLQFIEKWPPSDEKSFLQKMHLMPPHFLNVGSKRWFPRHAMQVFGTLSSLSPIWPANLR